MKRAIALLLLPVLFISACSSAADPTEAVVTNTITLTSDAFMHGQAIPAKYTCAGRDISPAIAWGEPPAGTQSFALLMEDLDAPGGVWVHWLLYNIPPGTRSLTEDLPVTGKNVPGGQGSPFVGKNSWGEIGYGGPCPPGGTHRYVFTLYALDEMTGLLPGANKGEVLKGMEGHILAQGELMGTFSK